MNDTLESLTQRVRQLSASEQIELANEIFNSLTDDEYEAGWIAECQRRMDDVKNGEPTYDGDDVMSELRARAKARR